MSNRTGWAAFKSFRLDWKSSELYRGGERIALPEQAARVLKLLIEHHGDLVTREEIRRAIWPDHHVDFESS